jgi:hypothetical protein
VQAGDLDQATYLRWYSHAWRDLADLFGPYRTKLVFTGEDYPFGPFGAADDLLAVQATRAGIGIRTGITELSNFHLSQAPAYGSRVTPDGHLVVDESLPVHDGRHVVATENECYLDCGYSTDDVSYAVRQSNLKALQLRMNWMYVVPGASFLSDYRPQWDWVRLSLGKTAATSADAWADLREAEDTYWAPGNDGDASAGTASDVGAWRGRPYVRNLERWLVQVDQPGSVAHRASVDVHRQVFAPENGVAYEGLTTAQARGDTGFAFGVDPAFASSTRGPILLCVTFLDGGRGGFDVEYATASGTARSPVVTRRGDGLWRTAIVALPGAQLTHAVRGTAALRVALTPGSQDLVVRMVRVIRMQGLR